MEGWWEDSRRSFLVFDVLLSKALSAPCRPDPATVPGGYGQVLPMAAAICVPVVPGAAAVAGPEMSDDRVCDCQNVTAED